jgi:hypothetical protein
MSKRYKKDIMNVMGAGMGLGVGSAVVSQVGASAGVPAGIDRNVQGAMGIMSIGMPLMASRSILNQLEDLKPRRRR